MEKNYKVFVTLDHGGTAFADLNERFSASLRGNRNPLSSDELLSAIIDQDGVMSILEDRFDRTVFSAYPKLKVVSNVAVGFDNIDVEAATASGVLVCNTPGVLDNTTADMAFALLLGAARRIVEADSYIRGGSWQTFKFDLLLGHNLYGKTLGIIGLGRIGRCVARRASGFDMKVLYSQRRPLPEHMERSLNATYLPLDDLLRQSDFVSINCPLTPETRHLISDRELALMKTGGILVNTARGAIVDEQALVRALASGTIAGAGLDVFEDEPHVSPELLTMSNVVLSPHIGSAARETRQAMAALAAQGLISAFSGKLPDNAVNPQVWERFAQRLASGSRC